MYLNLVQQAGSTDKGKYEKGVTWKNGFFFFFW